MVGDERRRDPAPVPEPPLPPVAPPHGDRGGDAAGGTRVFGHAVRFDRIAAASHVAAGFVTVEELIGVTVLNRYAVVLGEVDGCQAINLPGQEAWMNVQGMPD
jgi:hypothetical protein